MMKFQYEAPDGGVYEIEAPNEQALQAIIQQQFGSQSQQQPKGDTRPASVPALAGAPFPQAQTPQEEPSQLADLSRAVGRGVSKGVVGFAPRLGGLAEDAFYAIPRLAEWGITGKNDYLGPQWNRSIKVNEALNNMAGLLADEPQSKAGRYLETGSDFVAGTLAGSGIAKGATAFIPKANPASAMQRSGAEFIRQNASNPGLQAIGSGAAGLTTQALDENGVTNPWMRLALPMIAGVGASGVASGSRNIYDRANVGRALDTPEGVRRAGGTILRDIAENPDTAAGRLARSTGYVPGVTPTGPSASRDYGIMAAAPQLENYAGGGEVARQASNAAARTKFIQNDMGLKPGADAPFNAAMAKANADQKTVMQAAQPVDVSGFINYVKKLDTPDQSQRSAVTAAKNLVLDRLEPMLEPITQKKVTQQPVPQFNENGVLIGSVMKDVSQDVPVSYQSRPGQLLALKRDIGDTLASNEGAGEKYSGVRNARREMKLIMDQLDDLIEQGAPGYKSKFRDPYSEAKTGTDRLAYLRDIIDKSGAPGPDAAGNYQLSPPKYLNQLRDSKADARRPDAGRMTLDGLSSKQKSALNRLYMDMAQENLINQRGVRASGSNTSRNLDFNKRIDDLVKGAENPILKTLPATLPAVAAGASAFLPFGPTGNSMAAMGAVGAANRLAQYLKNSQAATPARRADAVRASLGEMYTNPDAMRQGLELAKTNPVLPPRPFMASPGLLGSMAPTVSDAVEEKKRKKKAK